MIKAGFVSSGPKWYWARHFAGGVPRWGDVEFEFSDDLADCDVVIAYDAVPDRLAGRLRPGRSVFVASEPPTVKHYNPNFLRQFDLVLTTDERTRHPNSRRGQVGLPWLVGAWDSEGHLLEKPLGVDDFANYFPRKTRQISVVTSAKAFTSGHRLRLDFVRRLKAYFGSEIDLFGRDINDFGDKTEVLSDYRYHIALENCAVRDYWTEKLSDPFLTLTYPIYYGCPNIADYFPSGSMTTIDINDFGGTVAAIRHALAADLCEQSRDRLVEARQLVLGDNNLFAILAALAHDVMALGSEPREHKPLLGEKSFETWSSRLEKKVVRQVGQSLGLLTQSVWKFSRASKIK